MKNLLIVLFVLLVFSISCNEQIKFVYVEDGRLYDPEGKELALYGVNLQPNLSWEYNGLLKSAGVPKTPESLKKATDESLDELEVLNCKSIRCHLTPADFTDNEGNLVETIYLDMLDYLVAEAWERGMYLNHLEIIIQPDVKYNMELWQRGPVPEGGVTELIYDKKNKMILNLENWGEDKYVLYKIDTGEMKKAGDLEQMEFTITPGTYRIERM